MADSQLQVMLDEQGVSKENARQLLDAFGAPFEEAGVILAEYKTIKVTEEDQFELMAEARSKRLALKSVRTGVETKRKELKEDSLRTGRAIDSVAKFVKETIQPAEEYLEQQEKFGELRAAERAAKLKAERIEQLMQYTDDISLYRLDEMSQEQFDTLLAALKSQHEVWAAEKKRVEDERIAKEKADVEEQERVRTENIRLKKEAEERDAREAEERKQRQAELDAERKKREAVEAEQRETREKAEAEHQRQENERRRASLAPDKEKLLALAVELERLELPALESHDAQVILGKVGEVLAKTSAYLRINAEKLL